MSWFWMAFFLILSGVAVGIPFLSSGAGAGLRAGGPRDASYRRRQIEGSLRDLDLDLGAGKVSPGDHAAAVAELAKELAALDQGGPSSRGEGDTSA